MRTGQAPSPVGRSRASGTVRRLTAGACATAALVAAPLLALLGIALSGHAEASLHVATTVLPTALVETGLLLAGVALVAGLCGIGTAWLVTMYSFPGRGFVQAALILPLAMPTYIVAYAYVELLEPLGPVQAALRAVTGWHSRADYWFPQVRSLPGAVLLMGSVLYPYVYMTTRALFCVQSAGLLEVARTLGSRRGVLFWRIAMPLARPAIALGLSLVMLETLNDIGATEYLGVRTLTVSIYATWVNRGSLEGAAQIACVMLLVVGLLILVEARSRGARGYTTSLKRPRPPSPRPLSGGGAAMAALACALPVLAGFGVPALYLAHEAVVRSLRRGIDPDFLSHLTATLVLAAVATAVVLALGLVVAAAARLGPSRLTRAAARVAGLGYAVPGTVLGVGLLWPLAAADNALANAIRAFSGVSPGLLITGSGTALIMAYAVRFLAIAAGGIETGLSRISGTIDDAARTLGRRPGQILREIHLPLARPALVSAALLVFVDAMKELPATLLLRPLNVDTLSTALYADAARGAFEEGALSALAIVAAGLIPVIAMMRLAPGQHAPEEAALEPPGLAEPSTLRG
jgi:iron(III) transport system permease protein